MPRDIDPNTAAAFKRGHVWETYHCWLDYPGQPFYANNSSIDYPWDPTGGFNPILFKGVGQFGGISQLEEVAERQATRITLSLSGIDPATLDHHLLDQYMNRKGRVWQASHDDDWSLAGQPRAWFGGRIVDQKLTVGTTATIAVTVASPEEAWKEQPGGVYDDNDQQTRYPGDLGQALKHKMAAGRQLKWGRA